MELRGMWAAASNMAAEMTGIKYFAQGLTAIRGVLPKATTSWWFLFAPSVANGNQEQLVPVVYNFTKNKKNQKKHGCRPVSVISAVSLFSLGRHGLL
jgi:hypothetical protein